MRYSKCRHRPAAQHRSILLSSCHIFLEILGFGLPGEGKGAMRFAKFSLMLGIILSLGSLAAADEIRVSGDVVFRQPTAADPRQFKFSTRFLFQLETSQLEPETMEVHIVDTWGGTPFTDWVPKPNFHGPAFTTSIPAWTASSFCSTLPVGLVHSRHSALTPCRARLFCVTNDCVQHFGGNPDVLFAVAGDLPLALRPSRGPVRCLFL